MKTLSDSCSSRHSRAPRSGDRNWVQRHAGFQTGAQPFSPRLSQFDDQNTKNHDSPKIKSPFFAGNTLMPASQPDRAAFFGSCDLLV
jgi:hypothetical protein